MDSRAKKNEARRRELAEAVADLMLRHGLESCTLKRMAEAAQTSDRMILHYFEDKNQVLEEALAIVSQRLMHLLESAMTEPKPYSALVETLGPLMRSEPVRPYLRIWLELATQALVGDNHYVAQTNAISAAMERWLVQSIRPEGSISVRDLATLALVLMDGCVALDALGLESYSDTALQALLRLTAVAGQGPLGVQP